MICWSWKALDYIRSVHYFRYKTWMFDEAKLSAKKKTDILQSRLPLKVKTSIRQKKRKIYLPGDGITCCLLDLRIHPKNYQDFRRESVNENGGHWHKKKKKEKNNAPSMKSVLP